MKNNNLKIVTLLVFIIITLSFSLFAQERVKIKESSNEDTKIVEETPKQLYQKVNPPRKKPLPVRIYPKKSSNELVEFGWEQFKEENYEHAVECFQELVTRKDSLADAYLGIGWSKLMLYRPIEETRIIKSCDFVKNKEFYILKPNEFLDLYSEEDECPDGWLNNAMKLNENGEPLHILLEENMPYYKWDWFPIIIYFDVGEDIEYQRRSTKGKEINGESNIIYNFYRVSTNLDDYCEYNNKYGFIEIYNKLTDYLIGDFNNYVIGTSYLRAIDNKVYWADGIEVSNKLDSPNSLYEFSHYDSSYVKIIKRRNQDHNTDTWDYQVFNLYNFSGDEYRLKEVRNNKYLLNKEAFSIDIYRVEEDGTKNHNVPSTAMTYLEYLRLDTNDDGEITDLDATINLEENRIRFPFIKPFNGLGNENIYVTDPILDNDNIEIALNLRYVDFVKYLEISRAFAAANKHITSKEHKDMYYAGGCFYLTINKRYKSNLDIISDMVNNEWKFLYNYSINYTDLLIIRAYCYSEFKEYKDSLTNLQRLVPDFSSDITNQNGVKDLQRKVEELIKMLEINIK